MTRKAFYELEPGPGCQGAVYLKGLELASKLADDNSSLFRGPPVSRMFPRLVCSTLEEFSKPEIKIPVMMALFCLGHLQT